MAVGSEKMSHEDKSRSFGAIGTAMDLEERNDSGGSDKRSPFMDLYAERAAAYMERSGASPGTFAEVAVKNHENGALNPLAQYQVRVSKEDVLASREIVPPLTLLMCSPIGDGAAAAIVCSPDAVAQLGVTNPVWVEASVVVSGRIALLARTARFSGRPVRPTRKQGWDRPISTSLKFMTPLPPLS